MQSDIPILSTNPYRFTPRDSFNFLWGEIFRKYWYVCVIVGGFAVASMVRTTSQNPFPANLILPGAFVVVFFIFRYRFLSSLKRREVSMPAITITLYADRIESKADNGSFGVFSLDEIVDLSVGKRGFALRLSNRNSLFVRGSSFKTPEDQVLFEQKIREILASR